MLTNRRHVLLGSLATLSTVAFSLRARAQPAPERALAEAFPTVRSLDELSELEIFTRMRCSPPGSVTTWWYSGHMLGRIDESPAIPMLSISGASQSRITMLDDGSVRYSLIEAGYYGDPDALTIANGPVRNRLTGKMMTPVNYLSPQVISFTPDLTVQPERQPPAGASFNGRITRPNIKRDKIWMAEELFVKFPSRSGGPPMIANSLANFEADVQDVATGGRFVPATFEYTTWNSFRPWMDMGTIPGGIMMRLNSVKLSSWTEIPDDLSGRIEEDHPGAFDLS